MAEPVGEASGRVAQPSGRRIAGRHWFGRSKLRFPAMRDLLSSRGFHLLMAALLTLAALSIWALRTERHNPDLVSQAVEFTLIPPMVFAIFGSIGLVCTGLVGALWTFYDWFFGIMERVKGRENLRKWEVYLVVFLAVMVAVPHLVDAAQWWHTKILSNMPYEKTVLAWLSLQFHANEELILSWIALLSGVAIYFRKPLRAFRPQVESATRALAELYAGYNWQRPLALAAFAVFIAAASWKYAWLSWSAGAAVLTCLAWAGFPILLAMLVIGSGGVVAVVLWIGPPTVLWLSTPIWGSMAFVLAFVWLGWLVSILAYTRAPLFAIYWVGTIAFLGWVVAC